MLSNLNKREIIILSVAIIIIILTLYYVYIYDPLVTEIKQLRNEKNNKINEVQIDQEMVRKLPQVRDKYEELTEKTELVNFFNISNDKLLVELKKIADENNIDLKSFKPNASDKHINISMSLEAKYHDLNKYLAELKRFEYWMDYKTLTVRPSDDKLLVNITLTFYKQGLIGGDNNE